MVVVDVVMVVDVVDVVMVVVGGGVVVAVAVNVVPLGSRSRLSAR